MNYEGYFKQRLGALHAEGRYHVFDLERGCGRFPRAYDHRIGAEVTLVVLERLSRHWQAPVRLG